VAATAARAVYNTLDTQTDPFGVVHPIIDYPGVPVNHALVEENHGIRRACAFRAAAFWSHRGAPIGAEFRRFDPPGYFGGNIDDWRITRAR